MLERFLGSRLPPPSSGRRLVVLTGARQVGKTTLARDRYEKDLRYLNLDSPDERSRLRAVPAEAWSRVLGPAILDEVQKEPGLIEKVKWAYDAGQLGFSVLLGSSRILLLDQVRESLAGRVFLFELWPLTVAELVPYFGAGALRRPSLVAIAEEAVVEGRDRLPSILEPHVDGAVGPDVGWCRAAVQHVLDWGGLPALLQYEPDDRLPWLESYQATYLERDLADLARLRDLDAFHTCHRLAAARAGCILSYSGLARDAGLPVTTVRRYLRYLEISYQTSCLEAWRGNRTVRLVKSPKLLWIDGGIQRVLSGQLGGLTGRQYESAITSQILVTLRSLGMRLDASYLRTVGGLEVDLLLEGQDALLALEFKNRPSVDRRDATSIERARSLLDRKYRGGLVVYRGDRVARLTESVFAVPDWFLLGYPA
ncbi:MAG: ATP-binding protein [Planctomycetes bacterium]|nr:ATP-binding protein [Planctomycetota bacterium]